MMEIRILTWMQAVYIGLLCLALSHHTIWDVIAVARAFAAANFF